MTTTMRTLAPITINREAAESAPPREMMPQTPEEQIAWLEEKTGQALSPKLRARFLEAQTYRKGDLAKLHEAGEISLSPQGVRLMIQSITAEDASIMGLAGEIAGHAQEHDSRKCIAHKIIGVGAGVERHLDKLGWPDDARAPRSLLRRIRTWLSGRGVVANARPMVGDHCFVLSTVADRASKTDRSVRVWSVHVDDVSLRWKA